MNRRDFLKMAGLASGTAALAGCEIESAGKKLIPYLVPPDDGVIPGEARHVRSTCTECPAACGLDVRVMDDRPVKLEGNPHHPDNGGALCIRGQASLARLYHPERVRGPMRREPDGRFLDMTWAAAMAAVRQALGASAGKANVFVSGRTTGALAGLIDRTCETLRLERHPELELYPHSAVRRANRMVFGADAVPDYRLDRADVAVLLGADVLGTYLSPPTFGRRFAEARAKGLRWFQVEPHVTLSGLRADERVVVRPGGEAWLLAFLLRSVKGLGKVPADIMNAVPAVSLADAAAKTGIQATRIEEMAGALRAAKAPLVLAGDVAVRGTNGEAAAVLAALLQLELGMDATTVDQARAEDWSRVGDLRDAERLAGRLEAGKIGVLILSRVGALESMGSLARHLDKAQLTVALADVLTPALKVANLVLPVHHGLESWGDASPRMGLASLIQPVLKPLHDTRAEGDILLDLGGAKDDYQKHLLSIWGVRGAEWLDRGVLEGPPTPSLPQTPESGLAAEPTEEAPAGTPAAEAPAPSSGIDTARLTEALRRPLEQPPSGGLIVAPSVRTFDGRSAPMDLLHEIPDPLSSVSWGDFVSVSREQAASLGIDDGHEVTVAAGGGELRLPARVQPALPAAVQMLAQDMAARLPRGVDPRTGELLALLTGARVSAAGAGRRLPVLSGSTDEARARGILPMVHDEDAHHHHGELHTLYKEHEHVGYRWGMAVDLDLCTGCSSCVAACYVENNIPVTGADEHARGREMSWLRIQPYDDGRGGVQMLPMMCQHCDAAPCEPVCPVYAAYHNEEGLNVQVYNRCVGTRYCANNCPYKARRFNWYEHPREAPLQLMVNPNVSLRPSGVMEKCTFCIQRIRAAKDHAKDENRAVRDGEVRTACQQACPTGAIVFGNLLDRSAKVSRQAASPRAYRVLENLGTRPAVSYLTDDNLKKGMGS